ncbi:large ribosomal subunit protein bL33m [Bacillus rossius redtenbacheri]|uniref:large ribosomal subunit protein bL33m n=1 Tax=Bacillus rossius redtenbacheri TaxID=93214 RepID=UPI002FDCDF57
MQSEIYLVAAASQGPGMFLTNILLKKVKSKNIMVLMESMVSGHHRIMIRERLGDKLECIRFDPYVQLMSVYKERKKIRSLK